MTLGKSHDLPGHGDYAILPYTCCRIAQSLEQTYHAHTTFWFLYDSSLLEQRLETVVGHFFPSLHGTGKNQWNLTMLLTFLNTELVSGIYTEQESCRIMACWEGAL